MPITLVNRIGTYDFSLRKFSKPPIRSSVGIGSIVLLEQLAESEPVQQVTSTRNRKSYQEEQSAYFVPGGVDPWGLIRQIPSSIPVPPIPGQTIHHPTWPIPTPSEQVEDAKWHIFAVVLVTPGPDELVIVSVCKIVTKGGKVVSKTCKEIGRHKPKKWGDLPDPDTGAYKEFCDPARGKNKWDPPEPTTPKTPKTPNNPKKPDDIDNPNDGYDGWLDPPNWKGDKW